MYTFYPEMAVNRRPLSVAHYPLLDSYFTKNVLKFIKTMNCLSLGFTFGVVGDE